MVSGRAGEAVARALRWGRLHGGCVARPRGQGVRGLSLFGSLLAMALLGTLVLGVVVWLEERSLEDRARVAGTQLETVAHAVSSYVNSEFPDLLGRVGSGPVMIGIPELKSGGVLPDDFGSRNVLGRGFQVMVMPVGTLALDVMVAETLPAGDTLVPSAALLGERYGGVRMGVVPPEAPTELRGPAVGVSVSGFQGAFGGVPAVGALAVLERFDHESVYGSELHREDIPGFPEGNQMQTDLDLGGNEIVDAGRVEAESFEVVRDIEVSGALIVEGALTVGEAVDVTGEISADRGTFGDTRSRTVTAIVVNAGHMTSDTASISRLTVGSCSGC